MNLRWIFDGIGAAVIGVGLTALFAKPSRSKRKVVTQSASGNTGTTIQAAGDVHVGHREDDHAFAVQPHLYLILHSGEDGPDGSYLNGSLKNVGRGIAREPRVFLPGIGEVQHGHHLLKVMEEATLRVRYDGTPAYLQRLDDTTARVTFENESGVLYEQTGSVTQSKGPNSDVYSYGIAGLSPVREIGP